MILRFWPAVGFVVVAALGCAQTPVPATEHPHFEVAAIKENKSGGLSMIMGLHRGDRLTVTNIAMIELVCVAYGVQYFQISGAPEWTSADRFDIAAKAEPEVVAKWQMPLLLRSLLEDRFELRTHRETKDIPVFELRLAKSGPKMKQVSEGDCVVPPPGTPPTGIGQVGAPPDCGALRGSNKGSHTSISGRRVSVKQLATMIEPSFERKLIDQTGLTGYFDFTLTFTRASAETAVDAEAPSLITALHEQLGLEVKSAKGPVDVLIVDHVERPSEN